MKTKSIRQTGPPITFQDTVCTVVRGSNNKDQIVTRAPFSFLSPSSESPNSIHYPLYSVHGTRANSESKPKITFYTLNPNHPDSRPKQKKVRNSRFLPLILPWRRSRRTTNSPPSRFPSQASLSPPVRPRVPLVPWVVHFGNLHEGGLSGSARGFIVGFRGGLGGEGFDLCSIYGVYSLSDWVRRFVGDGWCCRQHR